MKIFNPLYLLSLSASGFNRPTSSRELSQQSALSTSQNQNPFVFAKYPQCDFSSATMPPYPQYDTRSMQTKNFNAFAKLTENQPDEPSWYGILDRIIELTNSTMTTAEKTVEKGTYPLLMSIGLSVLLFKLASKLGLVRNNNQGQAAAIGQGGAGPAAAIPVTHERARG